jgi:predicted permease
METLVRDLSHAVRILRKRPLFTMVAALSIAIGIGASTAVFSVVNALLLKSPAGIGDPAGAVEIGRTTGGRGFDTFSYPELLDMREQVPALEHVAGWRMQPLSHSVGDRGSRVAGLLVSHNYFDAMAVAPARGRVFTAEEDRTPGAHPVAVVSHAFWQDQLGGDPDVLGTTLTLNRRDFTVIGVAPAEFRGHTIGFPPDVYLPLTMMPVASPGFDAFANRNASWVLAVGSLAQGATIEQADAAVKALFARQPDRPADVRNERSASVIQLGPVPGGGRGPVTAFLGLIGALIGFVLLITCANVAGMLLARAAAREREIAIRLAIGSGRARLVRQLVVESTVLFLLGGAGGVMLAVWITGLLSSVQLTVPREAVSLGLDVRPDLAVLATGLVLALVTGIAFGLAPAVQATRPDLVAAIRNEAARRGSRGGRLRRAFVTGQVALSLVLLLAAGLFLRSLGRAASMPTGFDGTGVGLVSFDVSIDGYDEARGHVFARSLLDAVRAQPGIAAAALAIDMPLDLSKNESQVHPDGYASPDGRSGVQASFNFVTSGYFETLRIPVLRGRAIDDRDREGAEPVAVLSRTLAERAFPGQDAIGKRLSFSGETALRTVVGIAEDVKNQTLMEAPDPMVYLPHAQSYRPELMLLVRGDEFGAAVVDGIRTGLRQVDPNLSVTPIQSLDSVTSIGTLPQRIAAFVTTGLGVLALLLSALGVYGVIAYHVAQRTREIGVRIALGARRTDVVRLILGGGLRLAGPGLLIGLVAGIALSRLIRGFILGVAPVDPLTFAAVPAVLLIAVALASWLPARRASAIEPTVALRSD